MVRRVRGLGMEDMPLKLALPLATIRLALEATDKL